MKSQKNGLMESIPIYLPQYKEEAVAIDKESDEYRKGRQRGVRSLARFLRKAIIEASLELQETTEREEREKIKEDLLGLSALYATIFNHEALFYSQLDEGKLLSEPEIKYGKLALGKDQYMSFEELNLKWSKDFIPF